MQLPEAIEDKLSRLADEKAEIEAELQARIERIELKETVLREMLAEYDDAASLLARAGGEPESKLVKAGPALSPADAIRNLLQQHPEGLPQKTIVITLESQIASTSSNKRRLLYNTIFNLRKRGTIVDDGPFVRLQQQG